LNGQKPVRSRSPRGQPLRERVVVSWPEVQTRASVATSEARSGFVADHDDPMDDEDSLRNTQADNAPRARGSALLRLLQKPGSLRRRRIFIVLLISIPLWLYAATWDIVMMLLDDAASGKGAGWSDIGQRVLTRLLLLPLLVGAYLLAVNISLQRRRAVWFAAGQTAIALGFSLLTPPALALSYYLTNRAYADSHSLRQALALIGPWQEWLASTVQYSIVYLLGLVLILALNAFLRYKSEQIKAAQLRSKWLEAKLGILRGQLNPHFFFNALNAIVALIHTEPDRAERLLTELSALLRRSLTETHHEFTTVKDEMQFIERYLAVMKARYEDRLSVCVQLEPQLLDLSIPTFLLVPLVENAIKHGVAKVPGCDTLVIAGQRAGEYLQFTVTNIASVHATSAGDEAGGGVGLTNTRKRLSAIYGSHYRFESSRDQQGHWLASVAIPAQGKPLAAGLALA